MRRTPEERAGVADANLSGTTVLVTGSTSGIGREAALAFGRLGADVVVHGREDAAGRAVVTELDRVGTDGQFVSADFADVDEVRDLATTVSDETEGIDVLCHNAGAFIREGELTDLGVEKTFHVNHLSPYLLTAELLDHVADDGRIVTTASEAHRGVELDLDAVTDIGVFSAGSAYGRSKLANVQFAFELGRRLERAGRELASNAFHPGAIPGSGFTRFLPTPLSRAASLLDPVPFVTSVEEGAAALVYLAVSGDVGDITGRYFEKQNLATPTMVARDRDAQRDLWERSADLLDIEEPLAGPGVASAVDDDVGATDMPETDAE
jgi:NAD(P)-dependent dehydrogenase (short-subunit alcohol dehydrogenase family)